jgi:hypothetical protein
MDMVYHAFLRFLSRPNYVEVQRAGNHALASKYRIMKSFPTRTRWPNTRDCFPLNSTPCANRTEGCWPAWAFACEFDRRVCPLIGASLSADRCRSRAPNLQVSMWDCRANPGWEDCPSACLSELDTHSRDGRMPSLWPPCAGRRAHRVGVMSARRQNVAVRWDGLAGAHRPPRT